MTTTRSGRDGRPLVTTAQAAYSLGMKPASFRRWAGRHQVKPADYRATGNRGQAAAWWDLADIADAVHNKEAAA